MIRTNSDEYFIEPLERGTQQQEENGRVHVVYRRSALLQTPSDISVDYEHPGACLSLIKSMSSLFLFLDISLGKKRWRFHMEQEVMMMA